MVRGATAGEAVTAIGGNSKTRARVDLSRLSLGRVPMILMYHGVADVAEDPNQLCVTPGRFAEQMAWLQRLGLRGVGIGALVDAMRAGRQRGLVGITFDDGYVSVLEAALPELRRHGFTASVFIISGRLGGTNEWDEGPSWPLLSGQPGGRAGRGGHGDRLTRRHAYAAGRPGGRAAGRPRSAGAGRPGRARSAAPVRGFAYPYGSMDAAARRAVRDAGYDYACAVRDADGRPRDHGAAQGLRRPARRRRPDGAKRLLYRGYIAVKGRRP